MQLADTTLTKKRNGVILVAIVKFHKNEKALTEKVGKNGSSENRRLV